MAGYTSRFFLTLTIPSVFGFLSVLWFFKKKIPKSVSKAIQVESSAESEFETQFLTLDPMKLKNKEGSEEAEMQLKESEASQSPSANGIQQNGKTKGKKGKSKLREKSCTFSKDYILNDSDRHHPLEDNGIELANGIEAMDLNAHVPAKDELFLNEINKTHSDMEIANGTNSSQTNGHNSGDEEKCSVSEIDNLSSPQNGGSAKEHCDTDVLVSTEDRNSASGESKIEQTELTSNVQTDSHEPLTLPVDCTETPGEMLESPGATYCDSVVDISACKNASSQENLRNPENLDSEKQVTECVSVSEQENADPVAKEGSNDSGRGGSEIHFEPYQTRLFPMEYEFDILQEYVGLLIGRNGRHVRYIKEETNANILIKRHPYDDGKKICALTGTEDEVHAALKLIRQRFPTEKYPSVTLSQVCILPYHLQAPDLLKLSLPEGVSFDVMLSATVTAGHFFLQQPTHPSFYSLPYLNGTMTYEYSQNINAPSLPHVDRGYVCAANLGEAWYRAEIDEVFEDTDECRVKFLDYGGYTILHRTSLKQIRVDFMKMPFQATECYLGDITVPDGQTEWSREATAAFEELAQGQILQGYIIAYAENKVPFVRLFKVTGADIINIGEELVCRGLAKSLQQI